MTLANGLPRVVVVGSLNMDFVAETRTLPRSGETVRGVSFRTVPGGKGANQACAAAVLGGVVTMIGRTGTDSFGDELRKALAAAGVDVGHVLPTPGVPTGVALVTVDGQGRNQIVVIPGANERLGPEDIAQRGEAFGPGVLLVQLETPVATVEAAARKARKRGMKVVLDPAPVTSLPRGLLALVDVLTPNEAEAVALAGGRDGIELAQAGAVAAQLRALGPTAVVLKLGERGAWLDDGMTSRHFEGHRVHAVDTTGAGDVFNGALAVALAEGSSLEDAVRFACAAAALSVTRAGTQRAVPTRAEIEAFRVDDDVWPTRAASPST